MAREEGFRSVQPFFLLFPAAAAAGILGPVYQLVVLFRQLQDARIPHLCAEVVRRRSD